MKDKTKKEIRISCEGAKMLSLNQLEPFQGNLKSLSNEAYEWFKVTILELGFSEPFSVWLNEGKYNLLNGHQRLRVLLKMIHDEGYICPDVPVSLVQADSLQQAKKKVLALTSQYGEVEKDGLYQFMTEAGLSMKDMKNYRLPEVDMELFQTEFFDLSETKGDVSIEIEPEETKIKNINECPKCAYKW